jgi:hypothetical protein
VGSGSCEATRRIGARKSGGHIVPRKNEIAQMVVNKKSILDVIALDFLVCSFNELFTSRTVVKITEKDGFTAVFNDWITFS